MTTNAEDTVRVINSLTGGAATVPRRIFEHPIFGKSLVEVKEGQKPYTPELYKSQSPEEFSETHPEKVIPPKPGGKPKPMKPEPKVED